MNDELTPARRHKTRQPAGFARCADMAAAAKGQRADRARTEPLRDVERGENADGAGEAWPGGAQRQQQKLHLDHFAIAGLRGHAGNGADALVVEDAEKIGNDRLACRRPKPDEGLALKLAAEQRANPRSGKAKRVTRGAVERHDETVAQHLADGAWLDLGALGRLTIAAPLLPICIQFPARRVFHNRSLTPRLCRTPVPDRDRIGGDWLSCRMRSRWRAGACPRGGGRGFHRELNLTKR